MKNDKIKMVTNIDVPSNGLTNNNNHVLVERFKNFYRDLMTMDIDGLSDLYTNDVIFKDPILELNDMSKLHEYLSHTCSNISHGKFTYLDQIIDEKSAYLKWEMHFRHPKLSNDIITVRGISHIQFNERIFFHEDSYDMGAMLYQHIPLLKNAVKYINNRLIV